VNVFGIKSAIRMTLPRLRWVLWSLWALWLVPAAAAPGGLLATHPEKFAPITFESNRPKFHIPPGSRLARNEHPRFLLVREDLETLRQRMSDPRLAAEFRAVQRQAEDGYAMAENSYAVRSTIGLLGWRVELRPKAPARSVEFLHLLQVGVDGQTPTGLRNATHEATADMHQITLRQGEHQYVLRLNRAGPRGGALAIKTSGCALDEVIPEAVEDHWRHYRDEPHYRTWVTDPSYRVVIEPTELDRRSLNRNQDP
jgi:hypothetical protein